jgi:hypothetical protein
MTHNEDTRIDVVLIALRKRIDQVRRLTEDSDRGWMLHVAGELAAEASLLADYVGQPDMDRLIAHYATERSRSEAPTLRALPDVEVEPDPFEFCMSDVVDRIEKTAPDVTAYVEQTGGGCATIYAALRDPDTGDPMLFPVPGYENCSTWPIMAGPGVFDWRGRNHVASLDEFYVGPDAELVETGRPDGTWAATRQSTLEEIAAEIVRQVRAFEPSNPRVLTLLAHPSGR